MFERSEVSHHLLRAFMAAKEKGGWFTSKELAVMSDISERTSRAYCLQLVQAGIFDLAEVFPGHRYKFSEMSSKRNKTFLDRLEKAAEVFGYATA